MSKMDNTVDRLENAVSRYRVAFAAAGILAVIAGLLILFWPQFAINAVAIIVGVYAIIAGAIFLAMGIFSKGLEGWAQASRIIVGLVFIAAGILALVFSNVTTHVLALVIAITVGVMWIVEGVVTLTLMLKGQPNGWTIAYVVICIAAGVVVLISPTFAVQALRWLIGLSFIGLGVSQIVRAVRFGRVPQIDITASLD